MQNLEELVVYFETYRENGFTCAINEAREIADNIGVEPEFAVKRSFSRIFLMKFQIPRGNNNLPKRHVELITFLF